MFTDQDGNPRAGRITGAMTTTIEFRKNPFGGYYWTVTRGENVLTGYEGSLTWAEWRARWALRRIRRAERKGITIRYAV